MAKKNSIRVRSKAEYSIEVNDAGETISFDLTDTGLTSRLFQMYESVQNLNKEYQTRLEALDAEPEDAPLQTATLLNADGEPEERVLITRKELASANLLDSFYHESRACLDVFLGKNACQKIFGDKNYLSMFDDLLEQLEPHFAQMGLNLEDIKKSAAAKHAPNRAARRALK